MLGLVEGFRVGKILGKNEVFLSKKMVPTRRMLDRRQVVACCFALGGVKFSNWKLRLKTSFFEPGTRDPGTFTAS